MSLAVLTAAGALGAHEVRIDGPVAYPAEGLLLGNGDLSVSAYQSGDDLVFRLGKGDVWDRRIYDGPRPAPANIEEFRYGVLNEGWVGSYDCGIRATKGTRDEKRLKELFTRSPVYCHAAPNPKPVGEFRLRLPATADMGGLARIAQTLHVEQGRATFAYTWPCGVTVAVEAVVAPEENVLAVNWKLTGWDAYSAIGRRDVRPVTGRFWRWQDPQAAVWSAQAEREQEILNNYWYQRDSKLEPLPAPIAKADGGARGTVEQAFYPDKWYKAGFRCRVTMDVPGASCRAPSLAPIGDAVVWFSHAPETLSGRAVLTVTTSNDATLEAPPPAAHADYVAAARRAGADYWEKSRLSLPGDPFLENLWYSVYHARRAILRPGKTPPGLFFPSTVSDYSEWHNDFHLNYNMQSIYWGEFTANRPEQAESFFDAIDCMVPMGRVIARRYFNGRGVFIPLSGFPIPVEEDILGHLPLGRMAYMTGWAAAKYWEYYEYTRDREWLAQRGYPMLKDASLFYLDFLRKAPSGDLPPNLADGKYHAFPSIQGEASLDGDPMSVCDQPEVIGHVRHCLWATIEATKILGVEADFRAELQERLDNLANTDQKLTGYARHAYFCRPADTADERHGWPYVAPPDAPEPYAPDRGDLFYHYPGMSWDIWLTKFSSNNFHPARDFAHYRDSLRKWRLANGTLQAMATVHYGRISGGWTESLACMAPLQEMMLQSWDGAIRLFPYWKKNLDAGFGNWRAQGAFLVTAVWQNGRIGRVRVVSEKGEDCLVWGDWKVTDTAGNAVATDRDAFGRLRFRTTPGAAYGLEEVR